MLVPPRWSFIFFFSLPTLHGFAGARLQGGLNNFAPDGAGFVIALEFDLQAAHAPVPQGRYNL